MRAYNVLVNGVTVVIRADHYTVDLEEPILLTFHVIGPPPPGMPCASTTGPVSPAEYETATFRKWDAVIDLTPLPVAP